ncbi:hypothetical protein [Brevibacterium antiquum]|uniref:hypothetical protein n=1 Tax=Brevibacterium antiquum TaxID=234835 RepID=UPI000C76F6A1|nr:hypothetical protein [Brevibacterium antiquum]
MSTAGLGDDRCGHDSVVRRGPQSQQQTNGWYLLVEDLELLRPQAANRWSFPADSAYFGGGAESFGAT